MEVLKSIIAWALSPFVIGGGFLLLGVLCQRFSKPRLRKFFLVGGSAVLFIGALPVVTYESNRQRSLEYAPLQIEKISDKGQPTLIVVLGGGFNPDPWLPPTSRLNATIMARLIEGVRIYRLLPNSRLLISLSGDGTPGEKSLALLEIARTLDLDPDRLELLTEAESTADEAEMASDLRKENEQIIVATSASHMPRAMLTFADLNLDPIAAPTDFHYPREESASNKPWKQWIPSSGGHGENKKWLYETVATLGQRLGIL